MNFRIFRPRTNAALAVAATVTVALSSCAVTPGGDPADGGDVGDTLNVVATTSQVGDFVSVIAGTDVRLTTLLSAGASAHHFDPSPEQLLALADADVLVVNGADLEGFVAGAVEASGFTGRTIVAADGVDLALAREITAESGEADATADDHAHDDHGTDDHAHDDHGTDSPAETNEAETHDHDHGDVNPHLWTSPAIARGMVAEIASGLAAADPARATEFQERAADYDARLAELDEWIGAQFAAVPEQDRVFVSGHDALLYYLHDYDIEFVGALLPSFEDNAEPSAAQLDELIEAIREHRVRAIFAESSINPKLAATVAKETGAAIISGDDALFVDALGAPGSGAETYLGATVHNTRVILDAWGVRPEALPAGLETALETAPTAGAGR